MINKHFDNNDICRGRGIPSRQPFLNHFYIVALMVVVLPIATGAQAQQPPPETKPPALQSTPQPAQKADSPSLSGYRLPFTPHKGDGEIVIRMRVNDKVDANFLVDTGAGNTIISSGLVKKLGLTIKQRPAPPGSTTVAPGTPMPYVTISSLAAGKMVIQGDYNIDDVVASLGGDQSIGGILGRDILKQFAVMIDFENNNILLLTEEKFTKEQLVSLGFEYGPDSAIPISFPSDGSTKAMVPIRITPPLQQGKTTLEPDLTYSAFLDSGSPNTIIPSAGKDMRPILGQQLAVQQVRFESGISTFAMYSVEAFMLGTGASSQSLSKLAPFICGFTLDEPQKSKNKKPADTSTDPIPILGMDYLSRFRMLLDYPRRVLYIAPVYNPNNHPFPTAASRENAQLQYLDLVMSPSEVGKWSVDAVTRGEPFSKAGVSAGDIILKISGSSIDGLQSGNIVPLFYRDSKSVRLEVLRAGKNISIKVPIPD